MGDYYDDEAVDQRHRALRGTDALLYYPPDQACTQRCAYGDNDMGLPGRPAYTAHQCFYQPGHGGDCKFSSECIASKIRSVPSGIIEGAAVGQPAR